MEIQSTVVCACTLLRSGTDGSELTPEWPCAAVEDIKVCVMEMSYVGPVESKSSTVVPCGVGSAGRGVPSTAKAWASGTSQGYREPVCVYVVGHQQTVQKVVV